MKDYCPGCEAENYLRGKLSEKRGYIAHLEVELQNTTSIKKKNLIKKLIREEREIVEVIKYQIEEGR